MQSAVTASSFGYFLIHLVWVAIGSTKYALTNWKVYLMTFELHNLIFGCTLNFILGHNSGIFYRLDGTMAPLHLLATGLMARPLYCTRFILYKKIKQNNYSLYCSAFVFDYMYTFASSLTQ